jgi:GNAT superfamily N-acetyltransferase
MSDPGAIRIVLTDPDDPAALACVDGYYRYLLATFPADFVPAMLPLPLPDAAKYRAPDGAFLVAWSGDLPVGCVSHRPLRPGVAEIKRLWVDASQRGNGLARRLMRAVEDHARDTGVSQLQLDTHSALTAAVALYRSDGWTDIPPYTTPPANLWLAKRLSRSA